MSMLDLDFNFLCKLCVDLVMNLVLEDDDSKLNFHLFWFALPSKLLDLVDYCLWLFLLSIQLLKDIKSIDVYTLLLIAHKYCVHVNSG